MLAGLLEAASSPANPSAVDWWARGIGGLGLLVAVWNVIRPSIQSYWKKRAKADPISRPSVKEINDAVSTALQVPDAIRNLWTTKAAAGLDLFHHPNEVADGKLRKLLPEYHHEVISGRGHQRPEESNEPAVVSDAQRQSLERALLLGRKVISRLDRISRNSE